MAVVAWISLRLSTSCTVFHPSAHGSGKRHDFASMNANRKSRL